MTKLTKDHIDRIFSSPLGQQLDMVYVVEGKDTITPFIRREEAEKFMELMKLEGEIIEVYKDTCL